MITSECEMDRIGYKSMYRHTATMLWLLPRCARPEGLTQIRYVSIRPHSILMTISGVIIEN